MKNGDAVIINGFTYIYQNRWLGHYIFISYLYPSLSIPDTLFDGSRTVDNCYRIPNLRDFYLHEKDKMKETKFELTPEQTDVDKLIIPTVTKDSGKRETFASGMMRDTDDNKIMWHAIMDGPMAYRWAALLTRGKKKYPDDESGEANWLKANGIAEWLRYRSSAFRHFMMWFIGCKDEDHAAAVFFNINGVEYVQQSLDSEVTEPTLKKWSWLVQIIT